MFFRALNEMWKCQNLLRHQVKDLLDLIKQPKVRYHHFCCVFVEQLFLGGTILTLEPMISNLEH